MDDLISRQAAIDALREAENHAFNSFYQGLIKAHKIIADLPSAQPERKTGRWILNDNGTWSCDKCHSWIPDEQHHYAEYCLFCGAKMDVEYENDEGQHAQMDMGYHRFKCSECKGITVMRGLTLFCKWCKTYNGGGNDG